MNKYKILALIMLIVLAILPIASSIAIAGTVNYILNDGYESGTYDISQWSSKQTDPTKSYSYVFQSKYVYAGKYAAKVVSNCNDASLSGLRSELTDSSVIQGQEYWFGFAVMVPEYWETTPTWNLVAQWHASEDPGETAISPPLALDITQRIWTISVGNTTLKLITGNNDANRTYSHYSIAPVQPGVWTTWVFNVKFSPTNTGKLVVWKDGVVVLNRTNLPIGYNDAIGPYFKTGIYRANTSDPNYCIKTVYNDAYKITDSAGSYDAVNPALTKLPVINNTLPINKTTITNTTTNKTIPTNNITINKTTINNTTSNKTITNNGTTNKTVNKTTANNTTYTPPKYIPPTINVALSSLDNTINSDLECTYSIVGNYSKSTIYWYKNNHFIIKGPSIISKLNLSTGDKWYCRINVTDTTHTTSKSSNTITIISPIVEVVENTGSNGAGSTGSQDNSGVDSENSSDVDSENISGIDSTDNSDVDTIENSTADSGNSSDVNSIDSSGVDAENNSEGIIGTGHSTPQPAEADTPQSAAPSTEKTSLKTVEPIKEEPSRELMQITQQPTKTTNNFIIYLITLSLIVVIIGTMTGLILLKRNDNVETDVLIINYIEKALDIGYDKKAIRTALKVKFPRSVIHHHLNLVKAEPKVRHPIPVSDAIEYDPRTVQKVKEYIMHQKEHHFLDKDIRNVLLHYGYSKRLVETIGL